MVQKQSPALKYKQYNTPVREISDYSYHQLLSNLLNFQNSQHLSFKLSCLFRKLLSGFLNFLSISIIFSLNKHQIILRLNSWFRLWSILFCYFLVATNGKKTLNFTINMHCNKLFSLGSFFTIVQWTFYQLYMHIIFNKLSYSTL